MSGPRFTAAEIERACKLDGMGYNLTEIAVRIGKCRRAIGKLKARGWVATRRRYVAHCPSDFALRFDEMTYEQLRAHYGVGIRTIRIWVTERGLTPRRKGGNNRPPRLIPADYVERRGTMTEKQATRAFGACRLTLRKWDRLTGRTAPRIGWAERMFLPHPSSPFGRAPMAALAHHGRGHVLGDA